MNSRANIPTAGKGSLIGLLEESVNRVFEDAVSDPEFGEIFQQWKNFMIQQMHLAPVLEHEKFVLEEVSVPTFEDEDVKKELSGDMQEEVKKEYQELLQIMHDHDIKENTEFSVPLANLTQETEESYKQIELLQKGNSDYNSRVQRMIDSLAATQIEFSSSETSEAERALMNCLLMKF
jgi:hypothetical protein